VPQKLTWDRAIRLFEKHLTTNLNKRTARRYVREIERFHDFIARRRDVNVKRVTVDHLGRYEETLRRRWIFALKAITQFYGFLADKKLT
jgi:site-specific recombinase XerD